MDAWMCLLGLAVGVLYCYINVTLLHAQGHIVYIETFVAAALPELMFLSISMVNNCPPCTAATVLWFIVSQFGWSILLMIPAGHMALRLFIRRRVVRVEYLDS